MSEPLSIAGGTEPGRQGVALFPFYRGAVGIRERDGWLDVAFFAPEVNAKLPATGFLDGAKVRIASVAARQIDPSARPRGAMCAITAIVVPEDS